MRKILNIGSLNLDRTLYVDKFVQAGETVRANELRTSAGGKGLNQSIALARAGATVIHTGAIGCDGEFLRAALENEGVDVTDIKQVDGANGQALIQVDEQGQNCIIVYPGSNNSITPEQIDNSLKRLQAGDMVLLQNETSNLSYALSAARAAGLYIVLNPSPLTDSLKKMNLGAVNCLILNETEAKGLTGCDDNSPRQLISALRKKYSDTDCLLTLGAEGAIYISPEKIYSCPAYKVKAVDTTAAGDTFTGYFLAALLKGEDIAAALEQASAAAALAVTHIGAAGSIPNFSEVEKFVQSQNN